MPTRRTPRPHPRPRHPRETAGRRRKRSRRVRATRAEPVRTCVGCRRSGTRDTMVRVARSADGVVRVGRTAPGRGAWLCRDAPECFERARARRALARALRIELSDEDVVEIGVRLYGDRGVHVPAGPGRSSPGMR